MAVKMTIRTTSQLSRLLYATRHYALPLFVPIYISFNTREVWVLLQQNAKFYMTTTDHLQNIFVESLVQKPCQYISSSNVVTLIFAVLGGLGEQLKITSGTKHDVPTFTGVMRLRMGMFTQK